MPKQQGSNRVYTRVTDENGKTVIRVEGTNRDENRAFIYMSRHFAERGLPVPRVLSVSEDEMSYTQEDLGDTILFDAIRHGRETGCFLPEEKDLLERTLRALAHIQVEGAQDFDWSVCFPIEAMDERSIRWDLNYFKYCFLKGTRVEFSEPRLEDDFDALVCNLTAQRSYSETVLQRSGPTASAVGLEETFLYRDCQSRNVMIRDGQPYFIDFQGGRRGPTQYDVASFLWQAKANIPASLREELIDAYLDELEKISNLQSPIFNKDAWKAALPHFVLFRTLQVLGAYGYRGYFERKQHFLESIPNALRNLREVLAGLEDYPYLRELAESLTGEAGLTAKRSSLPFREGVGVGSSLTVTVYSFSFKRGIPSDDSGNGGGYVFDCRSTHNPGKYDEYKQLTGLDQPVIDFLEKDGEILTFLESVDRLVDHHSITILSSFCAKFYFIYFFFYIMECR